MSTSERSAKEPLPGSVSSQDGRSDEEIDEPTGGYESYLELSEAEQALLKERIAEADRGVFISGEAMTKWVESWGTDNELPPPEPDVFLPPRRA